MFPSVYYPWKISNPYQSNYNILLSEYWCSAVRLLDQFTFPFRQLAPEHYLMKRIIKMDYSDLTQLWTFCYSREDTYINFLRRPAIGAFTLLRLQ